MVGAKAAGHHGVPETNPSPDTSSKKLSSAARGSTVQFYVRQRKKKGRVRSRVKLVPDLARTLDTMPVTFAKMGLRPSFKLQYGPYVIVSSAPEGF